MNQRLNLLIVEVSEPDAQTLVRHLIGKGFLIRYRRVETIADFESALDAGVWDVIISDYSGPGISAEEALSVLQKINEEIPLIVVSGTIGEEKGAQLMRRGACDFLIKNKLDRLAPIIERELKVIEKRRWLGASERQDVEQLRSLVQGLALAEKSLRESEERYRALASSAQQVWTIKAGEYDLTSKQEKHGFEITKKLESVNWIESIHPEEAEEVLEKWKYAIKNKETFENEIRIKTVEGEFRHYYVRAVPVFNEDKTIREWVGLNFDITERKLAEEELRKSEAKLIQVQKLESVGQLAGGIAHDFNNMLTAINGYCDLALRRVDEADPLRKYILEIKKSGERSALLTQQLLAFSRKQVLHPAVIDINQVVGDTSGMLRRLIGEDVVLKTNLSPDIHPVKVDPGQLSQVIMNLTVNARDAMPEGGRLLIETSNVYFDELYSRLHFEARVGHYVMLAVSDTGNGIGKEIQKKIFEPFFSTKEGRGTGLGLSTVYGIIKQSGGYIWVYSDVGFGTTFKIYFPQVENENVEKISEAAEPVQTFKSGHETILLVEDEYLVRNLCRQVLESSGYRVFEARNGVEAIEIFARKNSEIDLLMTDLVMPKMGGRALAEKIKDFNPALPILFMSGYTDDTVIRIGIIDEDVNYLQKPFNYNTLTQTIRNLLDG